MKTLWFNLLSHPDSMQQLSTELQAQAAHFSRPYPTWTEVASLPYLDACVNEAIRLHPPFCLPFERIVPREGMLLGDGHFLPGGTVVGMNPWVVNRHRPTFGEDADVWRPGRWLVGADRYRGMEQSVLTVGIQDFFFVTSAVLSVFVYQFGAGRRICLGKNIALLELKKLTAALVLNYEVCDVAPLVLASGPANEHGRLRYWILRSSR